MDTYVESKLRCHCQCFEYFGARVSILSVSEDN